MGKHTIGKGDGMGTFKDAQSLYSPHAPGNLPGGREKFANRPELGSACPISFDTYLVLPNGKEDVLRIQGHIHYFERGHGQPLVLLHGPLFSLYTFRHVIEPLAEHFRVIVPDLPGCGYSDCPDMSYTPEELSLSLECFLNGLGLDKVYLAAFGQSALFALNFAGYHYRRVLGVAAISPGTMLRSALPGTRLTRSPGGKAQMLRLLHGRYAEAFLDKMFFDKTLLTPHDIDEFILPFHREGVRFANRLMIANCLLKEDGARILATDQPVLIIRGENDTVTDKKEQETLMGIFRRGYVTPIRNCGYLPQEEKPLQVVELLKDFFL